MSRSLILSSAILERYAAASRCIHCKINGNDRPGECCRAASEEGPIVCGVGSPLYSKALAETLAA